MNMRHALKKRHAAQTRHAFTLVELLVVAAIIAVLVALLIPALGQAKAQANLVKCAANMRALGFGFRVFADQNSTKLVYNQNAYLFQPAEGGTGRVPYCDCAPRWWWSWGYNCPEQITAISLRDFVFMVNYCGVRPATFICPTMPTPSALGNTIDSRYNQLGLQMATDWGNPYSDSRFYVGTSGTYQSLSSFNINDMGWDRLEIPSYQYMGASCWENSGLNPAPYQVVTLNTQTQINQIDGGQPLMADVATLDTVYGTEYFNHGRTWNSAMVNVVFTDSHVETKKRDQNYYFASPYSWTGQYYYH